MKERILSYDVFRGFLLVWMVAFHVVVNLTDFVFDQYYFYFIALGFVLFLGVICGKFLYGKSRKKFGIATKLLAIFMAANGYKFFDDDFRLVDLIAGNQGFFSFEILLPMVLTLVFCVFLDKFKKGFMFLSLMLFASLIALFYFDIYFYNLNYTLYGVIGYCLARRFDLDAFAESTIKQYSFFLFLCGVVLVGAFLSIFYFGLVDAIILLQVLSMYFLVKFLFERSKFFFILGKHSLSIYVLHIVLLKGVKMIFYA